MEAQEPKMIHAIGTYAELAAKAGISRSAKAMIGTKVRTLILYLRQRDEESARRVVDSLFAEYADELADDEDLALRPDEASVNELRLSATVAGILETHEIEVVGQVRRLLNARRSPPELIAGQRLRELERALREFDARVAVLRLVVGAERKFKVPLAS